VKNDAGMSKFFGCHLIEIMVQHNNFSPFTVFCLLMVQREIAALRFIPEVNGCSRVNLIFCESVILNALCLNIWLVLDVMA
jgi:hypothetical protein